MIIICVVVSTHTSMYRYAMLCVRSLVRPLVPDSVVIITLSSMYLLYSETTSVRTVIGLVVIFWDMVMSPLSSRELR